MQINTLGQKQNPLTLSLFFSTSTHCSCLANTLEGCSASVHTACWCRLTVAAPGGAGVSELEGTLFATD